MFTRHYGLTGLAIFWGSIVLVGCGINRHPVTGAPHNHSRTVNASPPTTPSSRPISSSPSSTSSPFTPSSPSTALPSALPSWSSSTHAESAILYTHQQQSFIMQAAQSIGLPAVAVPMRGFGSQYQYTQRILMSGGGSMLVIQYSNFSVQEVTRPILTGRTVLRTVPLTILGSSVTGTWNQAASASGGAPPLTFHSHGMYYLIQGSRDISQTQVSTIAESLTKL